MYGDESRIIYGHYAFDTADNAGATGDNAIWDVAEPLEVCRIGAVISTVLGAGAATITFDKRITTGSDTGRVTAGVGTIIVPALTAAGKVVYKDVANVQLSVGDQVIVNVGTASASGGLRYFMVVRPRHETMANQPDAIASA